LAIQHLGLRLLLKPRLTYNVEGFLGALPLLTWNPKRWPWENLENDI
jgi:hypothetical protein